ncbi:Translocon-associated protein beta TRAPB/CARDB [Novymonas esmeraldas]|uniref:Translocon-associated protein beta TRAPB/CARDB n=1 Tax=Novymonas esmeraldas TaxID=1808958 RepID=A0AAW0EQ79_9TRYP
MTVFKALLTLCMVALVATTCFAQVSQEAEMNPHPVLFVSKTTSSDDIVLGSSVEIVVTVTNYGQSPAFDVQVTDLLEDGSQQTKSVASIPYGASETLRYTVTPRSLGNYPVAVAEVTYNVEQGNAATSRKALSNLIREGEAYYRGEGVDDESFRGVLSVLTRDRYDRLHARYIKESTAYIFLGAIPALFPYVLYRVKQSEVDALLRRSKPTK